MSLLHIMASRGLGGAETYAMDMILSLHRAGVDQCVVVSHKAPRYNELVDAGVRVDPSILKWPFRFIQKYRLKKLIEREKPHLVHCWMRRAASLMPHRLAPMILPRPIPVIGWFGGYYDPKNFDACTHFVGVTKDIVAHMVKKGVPSNNAFFVPTFPVIQPLPAMDRAQFDTPADAPLLLALSRLHPKKGLDTLLQALAYLPGVYLWLAGEGPLRSKLEAMTKELRLEDRVRFLGWRDDRAALLRAADICVLPSRYEPFGTVILEAWAAKTPLVACNSAGPAAHVENEVTGLLVPIDDVPLLGKAIKRIVTDGPLRQSLVAEGFAKYKTTYTADVVTAQMLKLYTQLMTSFGITA